MTKQIAILPEEMRRKTVLELGELPVNSYSLTLEQELAGNPDITPTACWFIYRDMVLIREFETMLDQIKKMGQYRGIEYTHAGPAHLSIGQEAAAVGECFYLSVEDHIFGSHRSHGEIIAKGLRALRELDERTLDGIMRDYFGGRTLRVIEEHARPWTPFRISNGRSKKPIFETTTSQERGLDFLLYGLLAEIFGRETGFNKGMGGSMHAFFPPFGIYPNNAIVGGSADIAAGAALYKKTQKKPGLVVANIGDASSACGPVWEAMNFAAMAQFTRLWEEEYRGGLPIIFNFVDNFYGMGGQPLGETSGFDRLARLGAAVNPYNMHAEVVDGNNPLAVADAYKRKRATLQDGKGPVLLDVLCYRQSGHSPSDQSSYRDREEVEAWRAVDPLREFGEKMCRAGIATETDLAAVHDYAVERVTHICRLAVDSTISPRMTLTLTSGLASLMYSHETEPLPGLMRQDDVRIPLEENPRWKNLAKKERSGLEPNGEIRKPTKAITLSDALFEAIVYAFYHDSRLIAYGEENRDWGGAFGVYQGLTESLPYHRLFNAPISEGAIIGTAVGYALEGGRALVELMYCDFMGRAGDEIFNQLPKWQAMSGGYVRMPVVVRVSVGSKYGAQHSQDWTALCAHIPGLKVVFPATPYSAKGLMAAALRGNDPVVFFESQRLYNQVEIFEPGGVPAEDYTLPLGEPAVVKPGKDLTILTFGATLYRAYEAAQRFEKEFGIEVELIDGRTLVPFNYTPVCDSVQKTGKIILASDACERGSYLHTVASELTQLCFDDLDAPPCVLGAPNWIVPPAELEADYFPQPQDFLDRYHCSIRPLPNYTPRREYFDGLRKQLFRLGL